VWPEIFAVSLSAAGYGGIWADTRTDTGRCGEMRGDARSCGEMRGDMGRYGEVRGDTAKAPAAPGLRSAAWWVRSTALAAPGTTRQDTQLCVRVCNRARRRRALRAARRTTPLAAGRRHSLPSAHTLLSARSVPASDHDSREHLTRLGAPLALVCPAHSQTNLRRLI